MNAPSTAVSASARWNRKSFGRSRSPKQATSVQGTQATRGQRDHEQVEPVDAELVADAELRDPLVVGHVLEPARAGSKSMRSATA